MGTAPPPIPNEGPRPASPVTLPAMWPVAPTRRGVSLLVSVAILAALWVLLGQRDIGFFVALLAASLAVAVLFALAVVRRPQATISLDTPTPAVGTPQTVRATVRFRRLAATAITAQWAARAGLIETPVDPHPGGATPTAAPRSDERRHRTTTVTASVVFTHHSRGPAVLRLVALRVEDPLGLVRRRIKLGAAAEVLVVPRLLEVTDFTAVPNVTVSERDDAYGAGPAQHGAPGSDTREYRRGDTPRQIHWKHSARQCELVVRLPERDLGSVADVRLETDPAAYASAEEFEHAVSVAATAGVAQLGEGNPVRLHLGARTPERFSSVAALMRALALVRLYSAGRAGARD
ncbi:hypothetical protein GCM10020360_20550 [Nonlabens tegetincola]